VRDRALGLRTLVAKLAHRLAELVKPALLAAHAIDHLGQRRPARRGRPTALEQCRAHLQRDVRLRGQCPAHIAHAREGPQLLQRGRQRGGRKRRVRPLVGVGGLDGATRRQVGARRLLGVDAHVEQLLGSRLDFLELLHLEVAHLVKEGSEPAPRGRVLPRAAAQ